MAGGEHDAHLTLTLIWQVANTTLKGPSVGKNIPTVAEMTQGEVIKFAAAAAEAMRADGMNVLMEGRAQTLDYVRTPHRFELTLSDPNIIGMRRAAQRMLGAAQKKAAEGRCEALGSGAASPSRRPSVAGPGTSLSRTSSRQYRAASPTSRPSTSIPTP